MCTCVWHEFLDVKFNYQWVIGSTIILNSLHTGGSSDIDHNWNCTYSPSDHLVQNSIDGCFNGQVLLSESVGEILYIFDMLPCDGSVTKIEYCYRYNRVLAAHDVMFNLTVVILNSEYTIIHTFYAVSRASEAVNCINIDQNSIKCCDVTPINAFYLPSERFAFGVTASDESEANLLAYHESASNVFTINALQLSKAGLSLSKGSIDLQQFSGSPRVPITPRCVHFKISQTEDNPTVPVDVDGTTSAGSVPNSQGNLNVLEIILIIALILGLCIIMTLIIGISIFVLVIKMARRANLCNHFTEALRRDREENPYGH